MDEITIKLLHERKSSNRRRKIDGVSGKIYSFEWNEQHRAYCWVTSSKEELADIFNSQGRAFGSYFAPVLTAKAEEKPAPLKPLPEDVMLTLLKHEIDLPERMDPELVARALVNAYDRGCVDGAAVRAKVKKAAKQTQPEEVAAGV